MNYDAVALRQMGIDPHKWTWFNTDYSRYRVVDPDPYATTLVEEPKKRIRPWRFILFLLFTTLYFSAFAVVAATTGGDFVLSLIPPALLALGGMMAHSGRKKVEVAGWVILVIYFTISHTWAMSAGVPFLLSLINELVQFGGAFLIGRLLWLSTDEYVDLVEVPARVSPNSLWHTPEQRIFGQPGKVADASDKFGQYATDAGVQGEEDTAMLLELLMRIPGTTVYHGLRFPGSTNADVDHAVAHGNTVFLIDSKKWRWGEYEWQCNGVGDSDEIIRTDGYGRPRKNHMDAAAEKYRSVLGPGVNVIPLLLMHGRKVRVGKNNVSCKSVAMLTASDALWFMGDMINENMPQWRDNEVVRGTLISSLK